MSKSNIEIDESKLVTAPTIVQRLKNAAVAIILGQYSCRCIYFIGYLALCSIMAGWQDKIFGLAENKSWDLEVLVNKQLASLIIPL